MSEQTGSAAPAQVSDGARVNWAALVAVGIAVLMTTVDLMIVQTALPTMENSFGMSPRLGQWLILAFAGAVVALQMPAGRWVDSVPKRTSYVLAIVGFTLSSVLGAVAPTIAVLIGARVLQGAFCALLGALVPALIVAAAPPDKRGRAMGVVGTLGPLGAVSGPAIGGLLLAAFDWRAIFLVNVPIGAVALILGWRAIPRDTGAMTVPGLDFARETFAAVVAGVALFLALTLAADQQPQWLLIAGALVVCVAAGMWWYREPGGHAVMRLLAVYPLGLILLGSFGVNIIGGSLNYLPPFTLDRLIALPLAQWGLVLLSMPLGLAIASNIAGFITDKWGAGRTAVLGSAIILAGTFSLAWEPTFGGAVGLGVRLGITGLGMGMYHVPAQTLFMTQAPAELRGTAGAAVNLLRQLGFSVGPALTTLVWFTAGSGSPSGLRSSYFVPAIAAVVTLVTTMWLVSRRATQPVVVTG